MNEQAKQYINQLEELFRNNYKALENLSKSLRGSDHNLAIQRSISKSQNMLVETCQLVNKLVIEMQNTEKRKPIQFKLMDDDFEEQLERAENEAVKTYGVSPRIKSFSPQDYDGGLEELVRQINEQIKLNNEDDNNGGALLHV